MHFKSALIAAAVFLSFNSPAWGDEDIALANAKSAAEAAAKVIHDTQQAARDPEPETDAATAPDPIPSETDLWRRIRSGFALQDSDSPLVAKHEGWYAGHPYYVERMAGRSKLYLYYIVGEVEKRGMPTEIALLPMIESAFIPNALSRRKASGIWQFVPGTGKKYGLEQDWWYDGRRDVVDATQAALDYLQNLHEEFGDWELALAAYNCGEKKVARLLAQNRAKGLPEDYQSLKKLPRETKNYIPKLIAIRNIVNNPASYGLSLDEIPNEPYFTTVSAPSHIDVKLAAQLANMPLEDFVSLNPAYIRPVIKSETTILLLPLDKVDTFAENLENHDEPLVSWQIYRAVKGEWLDKIAQRFGISLARLKQVNGIRPRSKITDAGQMLLVPFNSGMTTFSTTRKPSCSLHPLY